MRSIALAVALSALAANAANKSIAITYFDINGGSDDFKPLGKGMADMLITDLLVVKSINIVERSRLNAILDEMKLSKSPYIDPTTALKLGKGLAATHMLTGSINIVGTKMRIDARVFEVGQSKVVQSKQVEGEAQEFFALEKELVDLLIDALEIKPDLKEKSALRKSQTESLDAIKGYSQGLDALDKGDKSGAQAAFATAAKADPAWPALKTALESLTRELDAAEAKGAQSLDQKLAALRPEDPDLYAKVEKLANPSGVFPDVKDAAKRQVLVGVMKRGLRPSKDRYVGFDVGASNREYWEVVELFDQLANEPDTIANVPVILEYLVRKYPDDPTFLQRVTRDLENSGWAKAVAKLDLAKTAPCAKGSDWSRLRCEFLASHAKLVPLPSGLPRDPRKAMTRIEELLAKESARRTAEFNGIIKKRMAALSTTDKKVLTEQLHELINNLGTWRSEHDLEGTRLFIALDRWLVDHPDIRPHNGTDSDPSYIELGTLTQWIGRHTSDPDSWELIPGVGEYLLKKFPDVPSLPGELRLHLQSLTNIQKDGADRARKEWAERTKREAEKQASPEVRALFKHTAETGKKWKKK